MFKKTLSIKFIYECLIHNMKCIGTQRGVQGRAPPRMQDCHQPEVPHQAEGGNNSVKKFEVLKFLQ